MSQNNISSFDAEQIIDTLRYGVVPSHNANAYSVGREYWLDAVTDDLIYVSKGASKLRFISAKWGGGKTHFLTLIKEKTLKLNFVLTYVELNSREAPLDKLETLFKKLIRGLVFPGDLTFNQVLDKWANNFPLYDSAEEINTEIAKICPSLDFRAALRACLTYAKGDRIRHEDILRSVLGWLQGDSISPELKKIGVHNSIKITNVTEILESFLRFINYQGYAGWVIMLDEAEAITSLTQSQRRNDANQNIRKLLDNAEDHRGLYILFTTTPKFLENKEFGAQSYPALWSRIHHVLDVGLDNAGKRSVIIPLNPLKPEELIILANKIIDIHSLAYGWDATKTMNKVVLGKFIDDFANKDDQTARDFVISLVYTLDKNEEVEKQNDHNDLSK
jgi:P-loop Domain of unknown function (DUF2791)